MIKDLSNGRLAEIQAHATEHHLEESLKRTVCRFDTSTNGGCEVNFYRDFATLSLYFEITRDNKPVHNGGFIFHGTHDGYGNGCALPPFLSALMLIKHRDGLFTHNHLFP